MIWPKYDGKHVKMLLDFAFFEEQKKPKIILKFFIK